MPQHKVKQGECLSVIALQYGFRDWRTVYEHPKNEALRQKRPDPNLLYPGDVIFIPERAAKSHPCAAGKEHRFVFKRTRRELKVKVLGADGEPLRNEPFTLEGGGEVFEGTTDGEGVVTQEVPVSLGAATLRVGELSWKVGIGTINPIEDTEDGGVSGVQARLRNLGFDPGPVNGEMSERTRLAICSFEALHDLEITGELAGKTIAKLKEVHGC